MPIYKEFQQRASQPSSKLTQTLYPGHREDLYVYHVSEDPQKPLTLIYNRLEIITPHELEVVYDPNSLIRLFRQRFFPHHTKLLPKSIGRFDGRSINAFFEDKRCVDSEAKISRIYWSLD